MVGLAAERSWLCFPPTTPPPLRRLYMSALRLPPTAQSRGCCSTSCDHKRVNEQREEVANGWMGLEQKKKTSREIMNMIVNSVANLATLSLYLANIQTTSHLPFKNMIDNETN